MKDLRSYAHQTNIRLIIGAFLILMIVGEGLIYVFYGPGGAVTGLLCIGSGLIPIFLIIGIIYVMEWLVKRNNDRNG
jgi:hypothetical protein